MNNYIEKELMNILNWIELIDKENGNTSNFNTRDLEENIRYIFKFLDIKINDIEISSIKDIFLEKYNGIFSKENFYNIFIISNKQKIKDHNSVIKAFESINHNKQINFIEINILDDHSKNENFEYSYLLLNLLDDIKKSKYLKDGKFFYKEYLKNQFNF